MSPAASEECQRDLIGAWPRRPESVLSAGDPSNASDGGSRVIVVGVDAHSQTHTAAAVDAQTGEQLGELTADADAEGPQALLRFGERHGQDGRLWAIETAGTSWARFSGSCSEAVRRCCGCRRR